MATSEQVERADWAGRRAREHKGGRRGGSTRHVLPAPSATPAMRRAAALAVCARAGSASDARHLLQALGLAGGAQ